MLRVLLVAVLALSTLACSKTYIPNSDVEDTKENWDVIKFCEVYRHAMEDRNVAQLLKMMSPGYFEDAGNAKAEDDADYDKIREFLTTDFLHTAGVRYEIRYRKVTFTQTQHINVDYTFAAAWKIPGIEKEEWRHVVADNRLELVRDGESYKILAGM